MRRATRADRLAISDVESSGVVWDLPVWAGEPSGVTTTVIEWDRRIVAVARAFEAHVSPRWAAEPLPGWDGVLDQDLPPNAVVAHGLHIHHELPSHQRRQVHRLTRTLVAQQAAARWALAFIPLPRLAHHGPAGIVQQIIAGASDHEPLTTPLEDGYWPVAIGHDGTSVVCAWRNDVM